MSLWQRSLNGMISGAGSIVIKTGLNLLVIPVMLMQLGVDAFGLYILLIGILELSTLLDMGMTSALAKLLSEDDNPRHTAYLKVGVALFAGIATLFLLGGLLLLPGFNALFHIPEALSGIAGLCLLLILLEGALTLYSSYYRAVLLSHCLHQWTNVGDVLFYFIVNLGALGLLLGGYDLTAVLAVRLLGSLLRLLLLAFQAVKAEPLSLLPEAPFHREVLREVTSLSGHGLLINLSVIISHKIDVFIIALFLPLSAVAVYEVVFRFLGITLQVCVKLSEGVYPLFSRMAAAGQTGEARQLFLRMSSFLNLVAMLMLSLIVAFYAQLFGMFSAGRIPIEQTLPILWVAVPCVWSGVVQMPATAYLFSSGHQKYLTVSSLLAALANLALSLALVQPLGVLGVALGTLIPQLIQHQASLIRSTARWLGISLKDYVLAVHATALRPLVFACMLAVPLGLWLSVGWMSLVTVALAAATALLGGFILWFRHSATEAERQLLQEMVWLPVRRRLAPYVPFLTLSRKPS